MRGGHQVFESFSLSLITPPNLGGAAGNCSPGAWSWRSANPGHPSLLGGCGHASQGHHEQECLTAEHRCSSPAFHALAPSGTVETRATGSVLLNSWFGCTGHDEQLASPKERRAFKDWRWLTVGGSALFCAPRPLALGVEVVPWVWTCTSGGAPATAARQACREARRQEQRPCQRREAKGFTPPSSRPCDGLKRLNSEPTCVRTVLRVKSARRWWASLACSAWLPASSLEANATEAQNVLVLYAHNRVLPAAVEAESGLRAPWSVRRSAHRVLHRNARHPSLQRGALNSVR